MQLITRWLMISCLLFVKLSLAEGTCQGRLVDPLRDICWSCILPISIGSFTMGKGEAPKKRDTKNPNSPLCLCTRDGVPVPGVSIGFWEPTNLVDITRTPYCMTNLGGVQLGSNVKKVSSYARGYGKQHAHHSFYHVHYYQYPLIYWLKLITDFACLSPGEFDLLYLSELDPSWNDDKLQALINPEAFLFGNVIAQAACGIDCASATLALPQDHLFWCAGCLGNLYPLSGANADHVGGIQAASLYTARLLAKMHRLGQALETATSNCRINGPLCRKTKAYKIKKSQYKLQLVNPKSSNGDLGCWPLGLSDLLYSSGKEYPYDGQDFGFLIWRKTNCCACAM